MMLAAVAVGLTTSIAQAGIVFDVGRIAYSFECHAAVFWSSISPRVAGFKPGVCSSAVHAGLISAARCDIRRIVKAICDSRHDRRLFSASFRPVLFVIG